MHKSVILIGSLLLGSAMAFPQQQTGLPAGIPVPPPPTSNVRSAAGGSAVAPAHFRVHVVDGRNGMPIRNAHMKLWYDEPAGSGYGLATDEHGDANMPAPVGEPVRVLITITDYSDCRKQLRDDPPQGYSLDDIAHSGLAAQNTCGQVPVHRRPGELILFARPQRWYEGLNRTNGN